MTTGKHSYASPSEKVVGLFAFLLFTGRAYSLNQLAQQFRCSKQTILRNVEQLNRSKRITIESWMEDGQRWYRSASPCKTPIVTLDAEAIQHLLLCRDFVWHLLPAELQEDITQTIAHTTTLLPDFNERDRAMERLADARPKGFIDYSGKQEIIERLFACLRGKRLCTVHYKTPGEPAEKPITVAPLQLVAYREGLYVQARYAKALEDPDGDYFDPLLAVHRMTGVDVLDQTFSISGDEARPAGKTFGFMSGEPFRVRVAISNRAASYVSERIWSDDQVIRPVDGGGVELEFTATSPAEVISWVLSFGPEARLLDPPRLVQDIQQRITAMREAYAPKDPPPKAPEQAQLRESTK